MLAEDTFGKGHISRHPDEGQFLMFVPVPDGLSGNPSSKGIKRCVSRTHRQSRGGVELYER